MDEELRKLAEEAGLLEEARHPWQAFSISQDSRKLEAFAALVAKAALEAFEQSHDWLGEEQ